MGPACPSPLTAGCHVASSHVAQGMPALPRNTSSCHGFNTTPHALAPTTTRGRATLHAVAVRAVTVGAVTVGAVAVRAVTVGAADGLPGARSAVRGVGLGVRIGGGRRNGGAGGSRRPGSYSDSGRGSYSDSGRGRSAVVRCSVGDHPAEAPTYDMGALAPSVSEASLNAHYSHYLAVLERLNRHLDADDALKRLPLRELVQTAYNNGNPLPCFNLAAEVFNHQMLWASMIPGGGAIPKGEILDLLERDFGSVEAFKTEFRAAALSSFGSGWVWLSAKVETLVPQMWLRDLAAHNPYRLSVATLAVEKTSNALNPICFDRIPLLALDMWEHAYMADYGMDKAAYVDAFLNNLLCWEAVAARIEDAKAYANFREMPTPETSLFRPGHVGDFALADAPITQEKALAVLRDAPPPPDTEA